METKQTGEPHSRSRKDPAEEYGKGYVALAVVEEGRHNHKQG